MRASFRKAFRISSGVAVFFFGCLYLQHVINVAADTPAYRPKRKKKPETVEDTPETRPVEDAAPDVSA